MSVNPSVITYKLGSKLQQWLVFSIALSMLPFVFRFVPSALGVRSVPSAAEVFGDGELFIVAVTMSAAAFGDLMMARRSGLGVRKMTAGVAASAVALGSYLYAGARMIPGATPTNIVVSSANLFFASVAIGTIAILAAEA